MRRARTLLLDKPRNIDGMMWTGRATYTRAKIFDQLRKLASAKNLRGYDGVADGIWVTRRGDQSIYFNTTNRAARVSNFEIPAHEIVFSR